VSTHRTGYDAPRCFRIAPFWHIRYPEMLSLLRSIQTSRTDADVVDEKSRSTGVLAKPRIFAGVANSSMRWRSASEKVRLAWAIRPRARWPAPASRGESSAFNRDSHSGLLASCEHTPTCLPSSHSSDIVPSRVPSVVPERARSAPRVPPEIRAAPCAFGSTDTAPSPRRRADRYRCCHNPGDPAGTGSAASDATQPARACSTGHVSPSRRLS
jgi:hypothetical protein